MDRSGRVVTRVKFLSTPSARRATAIFRTGCPYISYFYPRPPRGGRHRLDGIDAKMAQFLSTPSARRATAVSHRHAHVKDNFYPRPPRGGRLALRKDSGR